MIILMQITVEAFYLPNHGSLSASRVTNSPLYAGPFDVLTSIFKDSKKESLERLEKTTNLKKSLIELTKGTNNGLKATDETRSEIAAIAKSLAAFNGIKSIASSPAMTGNWKLLYTTNGGNSAGKLGPFVGRVDQTIDVPSNRYINYVRVGPGVLQGALSASWDNINANTWKVNFLDIEIKVFGIPVKKNVFNDVSGIWKMTFLDDDLRILYAQGRSKEVNEENIYILGKDTF